MTNVIPEDYLDLFEKRAFASLATLMPDGSPQVTPVWVLYREPYVIVNSAKGRVKDRNMRNDARVAIAIRDPEDPYRYLGIQGRVVEITEEGARDVINQMAKKYEDRDVYGGPSDETRVTYKIEVDNVWGHG
jgi:PPOX class probable F420-dependent enzyme